MIAYVSGILKEIEDNSVIVDAGGLGYRVFTPVNEELMRVGIGNPVTLYTYYNVREDAQQLFGFLSKSALRLFKQLINVNGVGPKFALAILNQMNEDAAIYAIASGDYKALTKVSGIGAKTAQRIVLDLKDKVGVPDTADLTMPAAAAASAGEGVTAEAIAAMESLGYSRSEALHVLSGMQVEGKTTEQIIKEALKHLAVF
ncbi:MAG: Holliday junction branch migration protein RuvA [Firmicutes bacterium]|nr:Holliday junction branch migration protein RuvA [Bacillota bacterium]